MAISPPPTIGAVRTSELPPCSSPRAETTIVTAPFLTCVTGISGRVSRAVSRTTRSPPHASMARTAMPADVRIHLRLRIALLRVGERDSGAGGDSRHGDLVGVAREKLDRDRRITPLIGEIDDGMPSMREHGFRRDADGVGKTVDDDVHATVHPRAETRVGTFERGVGAEAADG